MIESQVSDIVGRVLSLTPGLDELGDRQNVTVADLRKFLELCEQAEVPEYTPVLVSLVLSKGCSSQGVVTYEFGALRVEAPHLDTPT